MINKVQLWIDNWHLSINVEKCVTVSYGRNIDSSHSYHLHTGTQNYEYILQKKDSFKDLGITFQSDLSFKNHIEDKTKSLQHTWYYKKKF